MPQAAGDALEDGAQASGDTREEWAQAAGDAREDGGQIAHRGGQRTGAGTTGGQIAGAGATVGAEAQAEIAKAVLDCPHAGTSEHESESGETEHESEPLHEGEPLMRQTLMMQLYVLGTLCGKPLPSSLEHRASMTQMRHW
jgi:hypothetical protein